MLESEAGNPKTLVSGHFVHKNHVSLEFAQAYELRVPKGVLEGKYRRHIKLTRQSDIDEKSVRSMIEQAFS